MNDLTIRLVGDAEGDLAPAVALLRVLRPHLDDASCRARLARQQATAGYVLVGAWDVATGDLVGLVGARAMENMAWGPHLHVDDLVTAESARGRGVGRSLMRWAEEEARRRGLGGVYLEARPTAIGFYEREDYAHHPSPVMKKVWNTGA